MSVFFKRRGPAPVIGKRLSDYSVGESVFLKINDVSTEFLVVNQGIPSSSDLYDSSCDATWLLMKDIYAKRKWHSSDSNKYADSTMHTYLNGTFLGLFSSEVQEAIKQVNIPYVKGYGNSGSIASGSNGLSTKIFLLSGYEVGFGSIGVQYFPADGAKLDYFEEGDTVNGSNRAKRIAYLNGSTGYWWLRSPYVSNTTYATYVFTNGYYANAVCSATSNGFRPALIMPFETLFDPDTNEFLKA